MKEDNSTSKKKDSNLKIDITHTIEKETKLSSSTPLTPHATNSRFSFCDDCTSRSNLQPHTHSPFFQDICSPCAIDCSPFWFHKQDSTFSLPSCISVDLREQKTPEAKKKVNIYVTKPKSRLSFFEKNKRNTDEQRSERKAHFLQTSGPQRIKITIHQSLWSHKLSPLNVTLLR